MIFIHHCLFHYFQSDRWDFIHDPTIKALVIYYGVSIIAASVSMVYSVQVNDDNGIFKLNAIDNIFKRRLARITLLVLSPIVPLTIIVKSTLLSTQITRAVSNYKKEDSPTWLELEQMKEEKKKLRNSFATVKMFETKLEATSQLFVLITFITRNPVMKTKGKVKQVTKVTIPTIKRGSDTVIPVQPRLQSGIRYFIVVTHLTHT